MNSDKSPPWKKIIPLFAPDNRPASALRRVRQVCVDRRCEEVRMTAAHAGLTLIVTFCSVCGPFCTFSIPTTPK